MPAVVTDWHGFRDVFGSEVRHLKPLLCHTSRNQKNIFSSWHRQIIEPEDQRPFKKSPRKIKRKSKIRWVELEPVLKKMPKDLKRQCLRLFSTDTEEPSYPDFADVISYLTRCEIKGPKRPGEIDDFLDQALDVGPSVSTQLSKDGKSIFVFQSSRGRTLRIVGPAVHLLTVPRVPRTIRHRLMTNAPTVIKNPNRLRSFKKVVKYLIQEGILIGESD
jgi:hypothetical protein